jgi:predicted RNA-binding Zn-ribbon protein involved in translation (DUF1610 family)
MESKSRIKPNWFITREEESSTKICPDCGEIMNKVLHTPKNKPVLYQCSKCGKISPGYYFGLSDL